LKTWPPKETLKFERQDFVIDSSTDTPEKLSLKLKQKPLLEKLLKLLFLAAKKR